MADAIGERVRRYVLDGGDADLRRLLSISEITAEPARAAFRRVGVRAGWRAIDCGCGPGGGLAVLAEEPLRRPPPRSHPHLDTLAGYWELLHELLERAGVPRGAVEDLPRSARAAGLEVAEANGFSCTMDPEVGFGLHADGFAATRERAVASGIPAGRFDELARSLSAAQSGGYDWVSSPFLLDLALRKHERMCRTG